MKKLTVVIVSYNVRYYVEQCIVSVQRATKGIDSEIVVVDNDSRDGTVAYLRQRFDTAITLIESSHNLGFARANNMAIRQSESQYVLLLNPDTFVAEDSLRHAVDFMDQHPEAGGVGARMHNADGSRALESRRALPTPWVSMLKMMGFTRRYYMTHLSWDEPGRIDVMSGAFCMLRREALDRVGLLDEDFFMYGEDIDLSYRILKGGYQNWYVPADILHYKGESTQKSSYRYVHVFYDAMLIFFRKHYGHLSWLVTLPIKTAIYARAFMALCSMLYRRMVDSLGFGKGKPTVNYVFLGSDAMLAECRRLARRKALAARFCTSADDARAHAATLSHACLVYDTERFSFADVIADACRHASQDTMVGTYSTQTRVLITPLETIRG